MAKKRAHGPELESSDDEPELRAYYSDEEGGIRIDDIYIPPPPRQPGSLNEVGPRIIITKIINTNFKSYGETQMLGPFHKNFNAIVGPNGSGKSNVIDSLLFVFGYRASKIRSKKLCVLIHKSEMYPNVSSASVSVYFTIITDKENDPNGYEQISENDIVVTRTVNKDNSSFYTLNNSRVQYKDVATCLRKHGIDLDHNRFLILQGEVEQISLMKPKAQTEHDTGMLEYLEDIIGTARFKEPLIKIDNNINALAELRLEKLNRVELAQRDKDSLEKPMQLAVQFLNLENQVTEKRNFIYQRQILHYNKKIEEIDGKLGMLLEKETEIKTTLNSLNIEKASREASFKEQMKKYEGLQKQKDDLKETFEKANSRDVTLQADMTEINKRRKMVIELLKEEKNKLETLQKIPESNMQRIKEFEVREKSLAVDKEKFEAEKSELLVCLREETLVLQEKKEEVQTKLVDLRKIVDETKSAFTIAESELKLFMSAEVNERRKLETLKTAFEENKLKLITRSKQLKDLKQKLPVTEKAYKDTISNLERIKLEQAKLINEIKVQKVQLEETRSAQQATKSRGRVLDSLMKQKNDGNLPGLFGRLGDLGAIDQKYDVAVSTACGPLDNIIVDTVDTAQWCIEFLKQHNIGRATFIALDKQEHLRQYVETKIKTPENVPRLFDLIKVEDNRVRTAFYYALRDTLVANEIDQATRIAYGPKRFRVVSLKGDLIETSGTMSGGGRSVLRGRMGQSVAVQSKTASPKKLHDMESTVSRMEQQVRDLDQKHQSLEQEVNRLHIELRTSKTDLEKFSIEVQSLQQQQPTLTNQLRKQEQKVKETCANSAQLKNLQKIVDVKKIDYENANSKSEELQKKVDAVNKEINDKTEKKMSKVNQKLKTCIDTFEKCKAEIIKMNVAIKTSQRNSKKSQDKIVHLEQEKTETENKLRSMNTERKEIEADAAKLLELIEKITSKIDGENDFEGEREYINDLNKQLNKIKLDKIELDQQIQELNKSLKETKELLRNIQAKLNALKLHDIPNQTNKEELRKFTEDELEETNTKHMEVELKREEEELKSARPNLSAISEYTRKQMFYLERVKEVEEVTTKRTKLKNLAEDIRNKRQKEFHIGFKIISQKLKEMYQLITLGGDAELEMVDSYNPFSEGIVFNVRPPKKSWKIITNLSGGEKTLSSLALVFALHYYKPSPLYFMDEIDAALDFKNVSIVGNYIKERTKNAQFIIISLRSNMFELADHLIGIYKTQNITKSLTINPQHYWKKPVNNVNDICENESHNNNGKLPDVPLASDEEKTNISQEENSIIITPDKNKSALQNAIVSPDIISSPDLNDSEELMEVE